MIIEDFEEIWNLWKKKKVTDISRNLEQIYESRNLWKRGNVKFQEIRKKRVTTEEIFNLKKKL